MQMPAGCIVDISESWSWPNILESMRQNRIEREGVRVLTCSDVGTSRSLRLQWFLLCITTHLCVLQWGNPSRCRRHCIPPRRRWTGFTSATWRSWKISSKPTSSSTMFPEINTWRSAEHLPRWRVPPKGRAGIREDGGRCWSLCEQKYGLMC